MFIHSFEWNEKKYEYRTILKIKYMNQERYATFLSYNTENETYLFNVTDYSCKDGYRCYTCTKQELNNVLIEITDQIDKNYILGHPLNINDDASDNKLTFKEEMKIDGLFIAWIWYVFLMGITLILNGQIFYWAFISVCFFVYRKGKLKEEGYK